MMASEELASSVVSSLSHYLVRKSEVGNVAYNAQFEDLFGQVESKLSDAYSAEMFARFVTNPADPVEAETLRLHLARVIDRDSDFGRQLTVSLGGPMMVKPKSRKSRTRLALLVAGLVAALGAGFLVARTMSPDNAAGSAPTTVTVVNAPETTSATTTTTTAATTTTTSGSATSASVPSDGPGALGDGSTLSKGAPVLLVNLPLPNDQWKFEHGDHDVQITQFQDSLWNVLNTCNSSYYSGEQGFRLKNFSRIEAKAIGTDSTSDPGLAVKFDVFVNNDNIHPVVSMVVNPGETKQLAADLPPNTFALLLRTSLTTADRSTCRRGNAVWGSPYVVAAGK